MMEVNKYFENLLNNNITLKFTKINSVSKNDYLYVVTMKHGNMEFEGIDLSLVKSFYKLYNNLSMCDLTHFSTQNKNIINDVILQLDIDTINDDYCILAILQNLIDTNMDIIINKNEKYIFNIKTRKNILNRKLKRVLTYNKKYTFYEIMMSLLYELIDDYTFVDTMFFTSNDVIKLKEYFKKYNLNRIRNL